MDKAMTDARALHKLADTNLEIRDAAEDIRGEKVLDRNGEELGKVDALFLDPQEKKVRFIRIASGGFLGLGKTKFLLPVDAITRIEESVVHVDQARERMVDAPRYEPELVNRTEYYRSLYGYYGYSPYWSSGYVYPPAAALFRGPGPFV